MSKSALRSSAAFAIPLFASRLLSVLLLPVYTRHLSTADYGILELLDLTLFIFSSLFGLQQSNAVFYYLSKRPSDDSRVISTAFIGTALLGFAAAGFGMVGAPWVSQLVFQSAQYSFALRLYFFSMAFSLLAEAGLTQLRAAEKLVWWNGAQLLRMGLQSVLAVILLLAFRLGYLSMLWGALGASAVVALAITAVFYRNNRPQFDTRLFGAMIRYSFPLSIASIAMLFIHYGDRFFLERSVSLDQIGIYALAYKIGMLSYMVHTPFVTYWARAMYDIDDESDGGRQYPRITTYLILLLTAAGALIVTFNRPLLALLAAPQFHQAAVYIPWITLAYIIRSIGDHLRTVFYTEARTGKTTTVTFVGAGTCLIGYSTLIPRYGVWGAVVATLVAFTVMCGYCFVEAQRVRHYRFEYGRLAKIALAALAACLPALLLPLPHFWAQCAASTGFLLLMPAVLYLTGFFTAEEKTVLHAAWLRALQAPRRWQEAGAGR
jgi:O-antigen/teichoic acid export membrane protein